MKLKYDEPLSSFAFNFQHARYTVGLGAHAALVEGSRDALCKTHDQLDMLIGSISDESHANGSEAGSVLLPQVLRDLANGKGVIERSSIARNPFSETIHFANTPIFKRQICAI